MTTARKADWSEEDHPRADNGKFTSGGGGGGGGGGAAEGSDHEARAREDRAIGAGHLSAEARTIADQHVAAYEQHKRMAEGHAVALDQAHREAIDAVAALHEYSSPDDKKLNLDDARYSLLSGEFHDSQNALREDAGAGPAPSYERDVTRRDLPEHPDESDHRGEANYHEHPDSINENRPDGQDELSDEEYARHLAAHEEWKRGAMAQYNQALDAHRAEFKRRAEVAQDALERLHERQIAAHSDLKSAHETATKARFAAERQLNKLDPEDLVNESAFANQARDESGDIADEDAAESHAAAHEAARSMLEHARASVEAHRFSAYDSLGPLKDSTRASGRAIRELSKITGRAPRLPAKSKKSANRPMDMANAMVASMAIDDDDGIAKYDPDQPRDDHGRFGSGSGGSGGGSGGGKENDEHPEYSLHAENARRASASAFGGNDRSHGAAASAHAGAAASAVSHGHDDLALRHSAMASIHARHTSDIANKSGDWADHRNAMRAHKDAERASQYVGDKGNAKSHADDAKRHEEAAKTAKSANRPGAGSGASVCGMPPARYKLKLTKLDFLSLVDTPAQESAAIRLIKRAGAEEMQATLSARIVKIGEGDDPLVYCWAFTCTDESGQPYHDLQGDAITPDFIKAAEAFVAAGGAVDEMHDGEAKSRIAFAYPMDPDIAKAMLGPEAGAAVKTSGLMVAIRPTPEQLAKLRDKTYTGVSIAGTGIRELAKGTKCEKCGTAYGADAKKCASCESMKRAPRGGRRRVGKAAWTTAEIDDLPDKSFLYVESGGKADGDDKTTPRSLRHFPYRDAEGKIDLDHLRNAISRIPQSSLPKTLRDKLQIKAEKLLAAQHEMSKRVRKDAVLTSAVDGHQHSIDLDDPADEWRDQLSTSYQVSEGADTGHCHAWTYDEATGAITIAEDSGHTHTVDAVVPPDVLRQAALNESGERCSSCGGMCPEGCRYCPSCGAAMGGSSSVPDDDRGSGAAVVVISARAPRAFSTPSGATPTVKSEDKEPTAMADNDRIKELEAANARLEKMSTLTDAQRVHYAKLKTRGLDTEAQGFLALTPAQRDTALAEIAKADAEVYTSKSTGKVYRQSDPLEIIEAAKATDAMADLQKRLGDERAELEFSKRGDAVLANFAKGVKGNLRSRLMKAVAGEFKDTAEYAEAERALKAADYALADQGVNKGINPHVDPSDVPQSPQAKLDRLAADYAKANNVPIHKASVAVLETAEGAALYAQLPVGRA